jgi:hypothetical protein
MVQHIFFYFFTDKDGTTEKVLKFIMPLKAVYNRKFGVTEQKGVFEHC